MSEYTPTTEELREFYVERFLDGEGEFNRWLAQHDQEVTQAERERIIGLLETRLDDCHDKNDMGGWSFVPELFIALIKR